MMKLSIAALTAGIAVSPAAAQHQHGQLPYSGMQQRVVKALSEQQLDDLGAGRGMGLALAAELNGYPGPMHVLELGNQLGLTAEQQQRVTRLMEEMRAEAIPEGESLILREQELDQAFATRQITPTALAALTARIADSLGRLRAIHLKYHLTTAELLTQHQRHRYSELRGYR
jgi:Spy/CpxP family protein refolding chaperone